MRVLITARDAGSAAQNLYFVERCIQLKYPVKFHIMAEGPAIDVFLKSSLKFTELNFRNGKTYSDNCNFASTEINNFAPQFAMLGLSFQDGEIDLVAKKCADKIPCGVIQDYWGYMVGSRRTICLITSLYLMKLRRI